MKKISTKLINKNLSTIIIVLTFVVIGVALLIVSFAATPQVANVAVQNATASLSLSPSSGTYNVGTTITVVVNETSSDGIASVQSDLTYDKNVLEFKSLDASNTNFDACVKKPVSGGGNVYLACASTNGPQQGPQKVATVNFQVLAASSSSTINFASTALVKRADLSVAWAGPAPGANLTLKSSTGSSSGSGSGSSGGSSGSSTGSSSGSGSGSNTNKAPNGNTEQVPAGSQVTPTAAANSTVVIKVVDSKGGIVAGAIVTLNNKQSITDALGVASFTDVAAGKYKVKVDSRFGKSSKDIIVRNGTTGPVQEVALTVKPSVNILLYLGIALIAILFGVLLFLAKRMNLKRKESSRKFGAMNAKVTDMSSEKAPVNDTPATVIVPGGSSKVDDSEEKLTLKKPEVKPGDTLSEIERKVGAK